jgi:hypothetical protein
LSDPSLTVAPRIVAILRHALEDQNEAVKILLKADLDTKSLNSVEKLIQAIDRIIELVPQIEDVIAFSVKTGWTFGSMRGVSEQNSENIMKRHRQSNEAKKKLEELWKSGKWKHKKACVEENYEQIMRDVGLWKEQNQIKPSVETLIRWLQSTK